MKSKINLINLLTLFVGYCTLIAMHANPLWAGVLGVLSSVATLWVAKYVDSSGTVVSWGADWTPVMWIVNSAGILVYGLDLFNQLHIIDSTWLLFVISALNILIRSFAGDNQKNKQAEYDLKKAA